MRKVLSTLQHRSIYAYLDDVLLATKTVPEHLSTLGELFKRFCQVGLTIQPRNSFLFKSEIKFLGFIISNHGLRADPDKLVAIREFPKPTTIMALKGFHALASYYRRFVKDFSKIAKPITDAFRGNPKALLWTPRMTKAFEKLKEVMTTPPVLSYPQLGKPYLMETDGSKLGIAATCSQLGPDHKYHPVAYASRALNRMEENYSATDLEAGAVIFGLDSFDVFLRGHPTTIVMDNRTLKTVLESTRRLGNDRQQRWRNRLMGLDVDVQYRAGKLNVPADVLSRWPRQGIKLLWIKLRPWRQIDITISR